MVELFELSELTFMFELQFEWITTRSIEVDFICELVPGEQESDERVSEVAFVGNHRIEEPQQTFTGLFGRD